MLQVARLAPKVLGEATDLVREFYLSRVLSDGGFADRKGESDLYYTLFGLEGLAALQVAAPGSLRGYVEGFGDGEGQDFIHLCCLAGCRSALALNDAPNVTESLTARIAAFRTEDGGFNADPNAKSGSAYGAFLATGAYQDLGVDLPDPLELVRSLKRLETEDGGWANDPLMTMGGTNSTAAAVIVLHSLGMPITDMPAEFLAKQQHSQGGFLAVPGAPMPDLLSTATALHALAAMESPPSKFSAESCLDFIDTLWTNKGGFHGNWADDLLDVEYTFYGLLALGHLSL